MLLQVIVVLAGSLIVLIGCAATSCADADLTSVHMEKAAYFLSPGGDVILIEPGTFQVETTGEWLRLIPEGGERNQAFLLNAQTVTHTENLDAPRVLSLGGDNDIHMVTLFLPDGSGLWVTGSYSGIRTRSAQIALQAKQRFLQREIDALGPPNNSLKGSGKQQGRTELNKAIQQIESMQEQVRNKRQMASTAFQNFDQKANQTYNLLSSVMKAMNQMRMGTVRNMM